METASLVLFIGAAGLWVGAVASTALMGARVRARGNAEQVVDWGRRHARLTNRIAIPAALVALGAGIWGVQQRDLSIDPHWWIGTGLGAWAVAFLGSTMQRGLLLRRAVAQSGVETPESEDVQWQLRQVSLVVRGELLLLVVAAVVIALLPSGAL
jgi:hypothetical protein